MSKEKARDWLLRLTNYFTDGGDEHQLAPPLTFKELCDLLQEYASQQQGGEWKDEIKEANKYFTNDEFDIWIDGRFKPQADKEL